MISDPELATLSDIMLPNAPHWTLLWQTTVLVVLFVGALSAALRYRAERRLRRTAADPQSRRLTAQHKLEALHQQWQKQLLNQREAAYHLATILRLGFGLPQLTREPPPVIPSSETRWPRVVQQLERLRYSPPAAHDGLSDCIAEVRALLHYAVE